MSEQNVLFTSGDRDLLLRLISIALMVRNGTYNTVGPLGAWLTDWLVIRSKSWKRVFSHAALTHARPRIRVNLCKEQNQA